VEAAKTRGMTTAQALAAAVDARRSARLSRETQIKVANIYSNIAKAGSNLQTRINIRANALRGQYQDIPGVEDWMIMDLALKQVNMEARFEALQRAVNNNNADINESTLARQEELFILKTTKLYEFTPQQMATQEGEINARYDAIDAQIRRQVPPAPSVGRSNLPAQTDGTALPLPATEAELIVGQLYNTLDQGPAIWDGTQFTN
jgi:hypothetical protein